MKTNVEPINPPRSSRRPRYTQSWKHTSRARHPWARNMPFIALKHRTADEIDLESILPVLTFVHT